MCWLSLSIGDAPRLLGQLGNDLTSFVEQVKHFASLFKPFLFALVYVVIVLLSTLISSSTSRFPTLFIPFPYTALHCHTLSIYTSYFVVLLYTIPPNIFQHLHFHTLAIYTSYFVVLLLYTNPLPTFQHFIPFAYVHCLYNLHTLPINSLRVVLLLYITPPYISPHPIIVHILPVHFPSLLILLLFILVVVFVLLLPRIIPPLTRPPYKSYTT